LNFNADNRCHIYSNKAAFGNDIYSDSQMSIVVDTFTVSRPTKYHVFPFENFSFDIQNGKLQQVEGELYVSPTGDNHNSGIVIDDPLRTIDHALSMMYADSLSPGSIHLAEGTYSRSSNQERLPIYGIDYTTLIGAEKNTTIIDAENSSNVLWFSNSKGCRIDNITIKNGDLFNVYAKNSDLVINNTQITECQKYGIHVQDSYLILTNVYVFNNHDEGITLYNSNGIVTNTIIKNNNMGIISNGTDLVINQTEISENVHSGIICENGSEFTINYVIVNGNKTSGFQSRNSHGQLTGVIIKNNLDGGLRCDNSTIGLANVTITGNQTANKGGGIYLTNSSVLLFDPQNLCNIYLNKAGIGRDLFSQNCPLTKIYLDTFTVAQVCDYFAAPVSKFDFSIQYGKIAQVHENLFVSPDGDDSNEGISPEHPLKTIDMAHTKIIADSLNPRIIYLAKGTYSATGNNEYFPINCRSYVTLRGDEKEYTILDAEGKSRVMNCFYTKCTGIQNIILTNGYSDYVAGVYITYSNPKFSHVRIIQNTGIGFYCNRASPKLYRTVISDNQSFQPMEYGSGGIHCYDSEPEFVNVTMTRNGSTYFHGGWFETSFYFSNSSPLIINSIIWNNAVNDFYCTSDTDTHSTTITYSNIQGGDSSIVTEGNIQINWLDGNMNLDPLFSDPENNDYSLLMNSPCINAGTSLFIWQGDTLLNLHDSCYIGKAPDMGAVESEFLNIVDVTRELPKEFALYGNYPNPFNSQTIISFQIPEHSIVNLGIYNMRGQKITTLINEKKQPGHYSITWDAKRLSSGIYIYKLKTDNYTSCGKCLLLK
jgi:hypothetical protein